MRTSARRAGRSSQLRVSWLAPDRIVDRSARSKTHSRARGRAISLLRPSSPVGFHRRGACREWRSICRRPRFADTLPLFRCRAARASMSQRRRLAPCRCWRWTRFETTSEQRRARSPARRAGLPIDLATHSAPCAVDYAGRSGCERACRTDRRHVPRAVESSRSLRPAPSSLAGWDAGERHAALSNGNAVVTFRPAAAFAETPLIVTVAGRSRPVGLPLGRP